LCKADHNTVGLMWMSWFLQTANKLDRGLRNMTPRNYSGECQCRHLALPARKTPPRMIRSMCKLC
jgi:hypothetical protein